MSHYIFGRRWPLTTAALAILALSGRVMPRAAAAPLITGGRLALLLPSAQILTASRAVRLSPVAWPTDPNGDPAAPAVKLPKLRLHLHAPRGTGQRRGEAGYKGPAASPHRRTATPGARGQSGIGTRALALCAVKDNERGHRHQKRRTVSNSIRGNINAPAPNPLGGSEAAQEGGRLRPAQPALSQDDQDLIEASRPSRRLGPTSACSPQPRPRILPGSYPERPSGGLLLPSTGGLILDSAPAQASLTAMRRKFSAAHTSFHSACTLCSPRRLNCRKPSTGSSRWAVPRSTCARGRQPCPLGFAAWRTWSRCTGVSGD